MWPTARPRGSSRPACILSILLVCHLAAAVIAAQGATPRLTLELSEDAVSVRGVTAGAPVVLVSVGRSWNGAVPAVRSVTQWLVDEDRDGVVVYEGALVVPRSVWCAVDLASGAFAEVIPGGDAMAAPALDGSHALVADERGTIERLRAPSVRTRVWWLRPSASESERGAYSGAATLGEEVGEEGEDGEGGNRVELALPLLRAVGETKGNTPLAARPGDVIVAIDWSTLGHFAVGVE